MTRCHELTRTRHPNRSGNPAWCGVAGVLHCGFMIVHTLKPGDRVVMTDEAIRYRLQGRFNKRTGVFKSMTPRGLIRVLRDGVKNPESYHQDFWMKEPQ